MQQQELAQMRQRDANLTALAAIGPRKKRKVDSPGPGSGAEVQPCVGMGGGGGVGQLTPRCSQMHVGKRALSHAWLTLYIKIDLFVNITGGEFFP